MYQKGRVQKLSQNLLARLYNECIREAVKVAVPDALSRWPASYEAGFKLAQDRQGKLHFGAQDISVPHLAIFNEELRERMDDIPEFRDSFYVHEVRGTKGCSDHDGTELEERNETLDELCHFLDTGMIHEDEWWIDVGLEVSCQDHVVQWLETAHHQLLSACLPSCTMNAVDKLVNGSRFDVDRVALLRDFAGFRVEVKSAGDLDGVVYVQAYTTDKCATYQLHQGAFTRHRPSDLFPDKVEALLKHVLTISQVYGVCAVEGNPGCARLEVRSTLKTSRVHLNDLEPTFLMDAVSILPINTWWSFRYYRVAALNYVFTSLKDSSPESRMWKQSLALGALAIWMLNGLVFRQGEDSPETI
ncbi:hypothetical protein JAAARDRAFT_142807, partial [Jaapia argillacea MUCL 33604]